jgi:hypothetical protein
MPFEIGNTYSRKQRWVEDAIRRAIVQDNGAKLRKAVDAQMDAAAEGNLAALDWLTTRLEGKAKQAVEIDHTHRSIREYTINELKSLIANEIVEGTATLVDSSGVGEVPVVGIEAGVGTAPVVVEGIPSPNSETLIDSNEQG